MANLHRLFFLITALGCCAAVGFSQKVGSTSMQFLKVMPSARGTAMGEAYSVLATGAEAVFWNPSGVASIENQELSLTYISWIFDTQQGALSYAASLGNWGAVGVQLQYVDYGTFEETVLIRPAIKQLPYPGVTGRTFHPFAYVIGATYGVGLTDRFSTGLSVKLAHESLFDQQTAAAVTREGNTKDVNTYANILLFDFGLRYNTGFRSLKIGASVQNFGAQIKYAEETSPAPLLFRVGIAGNLIGPDGLFRADEENRLSFAFDLFQPNDYAQQMHGGLEYEFAKTVSLRAGYKYNYDFDGFTFGGGVRQTISGFPLSLDYAYGAMGTYLGSVHRISLGVAIP